MTTKRDWTNLYIITLIAGIICFSLFAIAMEVLKYFALMKWVFS